MQRQRLVVGLFMAALLGGCGGDNDEAAAPANEPVAQRGDLVQSQPARIVSWTVNDLLASLGVSFPGQQIVALTSSPKCGIDVYQLQYFTVGATGESTTASGALMVPTGLDAACQGARPVMLYAHGTSTDRSYNIANLSNTDNVEGQLLAGVFVSQGYIVVAPNYAGYDTSTLTYHPYLNADQSSKEMIDALKAARTALPTVASTLSDAGKLFVTGYSQGGHVAMATHRAMQAANATVTASAPMSGPYALSAFGDAVFTGHVNFGAPVFSTLLISSYQHAYGNLYANTAEVFEPQYATGIDSLLPSTTPVSTLVAQGRLPRMEMFSSTPPDPAFASITPPTTPLDRAALFALGFGANHLITNSYRLGYLQDAQAHPDGAYPTTTDALPPAAPAQALRQAFKTNDLRNWTPTSPVLLCGGNADPTVFYLNTQLMQGYWAAVSPTAPVTVLDVDAPSGAGDPYGELHTGFAAAKLLLATSAVAQGATDAGASAVLESYHAGLVAPFCLAAARAQFDSL